MRLINPWTGLAVDANDDAAKRLMARGFVPEGDVAPKRPAPKRRAPKRPAKAE